MSSRITEINKDTFWELIAQAKEQCDRTESLSESCQMAAAGVFS